MSLKRDKLYSEPVVLPIGEAFKNLGKIDNVIIKTDIPEAKWLEASTGRIGYWRSLFRSTYIRWALAINGLHLAGAKYASNEFKKKQQFIVSCFRMNGKQADTVPLVEWKGDFAAKAHMDTISVMASYGIIDMFSCIEEFVFDFYKIFLKWNPRVFVQGKDNKAFRKIYNDREANPTAWETAISERLIKWQRKKLYDGLDRVFLAYFAEAKLEKPSVYTKSSPETWAEAIKAIGVLRNSLIHGERLVTQELFDISQKVTILGPKIKLGDEIRLGTVNLMNIEMFLDQLLNAMNLSMLELHEKHFKKASA